MRFAILKKTAKRRDENREINLLDPNERKEPYGKNHQGEIERGFKSLPVKWAGRIYLIYEDDLKDFANEVNIGLEPRSELSPEPYYSSFYLRKGDEQKEVSGSPTLPQKWLSFLLRKQ